jgi:PAS domain S-box-containing protein
VTRLDLERTAGAAEFGRALVDGVPSAGFVIADRELRVLVLEGDLYAGFDRDRALGRTVEETVAPESWTILEPRYRAALTGRTQSFEYRTADGPRYWSVRMSPIREPAGLDHVSGVLVLIEEVTARVRSEEGRRDSERLQRSVVEVLSEGVIVVGVQGRLLQANDAARNILGHELDLGSPATAWWTRLDARHPDGVPLDLDSPGRDVVRTCVDVRDVPVTVLRGDGARRMLQLNYGAVRDGEGDVGGLVVSFHDVTDRDAALEHLLRTETGLRDAQELAALSSWEWEAEHDRVTVLQPLPGQVEEHHMSLEMLLEPVVPEDRPGIQRCVEVLRNSAAEHELLQYRYRLQDGGLVWVETRMRAVRDADGALLGIRGTTQDVTAARRAAEELVQARDSLQSTRDYLQAVTQGMGEGMVTLGLDGTVVSMNQTAEGILGWSAGELRGKAFHDVAHFRHPDGAPFPPEDCPILRTGRDGAAVRCDDDVFVRSDGSDVPVEYSASPFTTPEGVRGTVLLFSDVSERKAREARVQHDLQDLAWVGRINEAIEDDRLILHAQPIIDLATGETVQHELLVRMLDGDGGVIGPGAFLPAAERYGLIREIDRWVVRRAAEVSARGHAVQLNISADSLGDRSFAASVERELRVSGADCSLIVIELTETALLRDEDAGRRFIERVRRLGCRLALDDFGTGYGGFTYLKNLDVDFLKIDIEFVRDLPRNAASEHVVRAVVNLAGDFGQKTIAEGVEDAETLALLRALGVDYAQGFHIGRPTRDAALLSLPAHDPHTEARISARLI